MKLGKNSTLLRKKQEKLKQDYNWVFEPNSIPTQFHNKKGSRGNVHELNSALLWCNWQDKLCTAANFTKVYSARTMDVCYAFNANKNRPLFTAMPGRKGGLELMMDIQQYEYMSPDVFGSGLKVAMLDSQDEAAAAIDEMNNQVSAGMSVSIPIKRVNYCEVRPPIGTCNETASLLACIDECQTRVLIEVSSKCTSL